MAVVLGSLVRRSGSGTHPGRSGAPVGYQHVMAVRRFANEYLFVEANGTVCWMKSGLEGFRFWCPEKEVSIQAPELKILEIFKYFRLYDGFQIPEVMGSRSGVQRFSF